jgi:hypothetical protein
MENMVRKAVIVTLFILTVTGLIFAQETPATSLREKYIQKAKTYLIKDQIVWNNLEINDLGIEIYASAEDKLNKKPEIRLYYDEIEIFNQMLRNYSYKSLLHVYTTKGVTRFESDVLPTRNISRSYVKRTDEKPLLGVKISLDAGRIAGNFKTGLIEERFIDLKLEDGTSIQFAEGELTLATVLLLKSMLENAGAKVSLTRADCNTSALGISFEDWLITDKYRDIGKAVEQKLITVEKAEYLASSSATDKEVFHQIFKQLDFLQRAHFINDFRPDVTLFIQYNMEGESNTTPVQHNYNVGYVGGSFAAGELAKPDDRLHFLRLLVSNDIENSLELSGDVMSQFTEHLSVKPIDDANQPENIRAFTIPTSQNGVYCRNLAMTRITLGTICFSQSLFMNNVEESRKLNMRDFSYVCGKTSSRINEVAKSYYEGMLQYFNARREKN